MRNLNDVKVRYNSPACPRNGISLNTVYTVKQNGENCTITNGVQIFNFSIEEIKQMFTPVEKNWKDFTIEEVKPIVKLEPEKTIIENKYNSKR